MSRALVFDVPLRPRKRAVSGRPRLSRKKVEGVKRTMLCDCLRGLTRLVAVCASLLPAVGSATEPWKGPEQLGRARLGMSLAELQKVYPQLIIEHQRNEPTPGELSVTVAKVPRERLDNFGNCAVDFQLLNDKVYQIQARCETASEKLERALVSTFGAPHFKREEPRVWYWRSSSSTLTYSPERRQISLADNSWGPTLFLRALRGPAPGATPQPTPQ